MLTCSLYLQYLFSKSARVYSCSRVVRQLASRRGCAKTLSTDVKPLAASRPFNKFDLIRSPIAALAMQFYRRELPEGCISFSSPEGKQIFKEALEYGHMECFFKLSAQFRTQDDPAYCGLATLVMCLNSLEIDPGRVWKGPWRWFHEEMLDCCIPLNMIRQNGITLQEFTCLADCNALHVHTVIADDKARYEDFEKAVIDSTKTDSQVLVVSYSRKGFKQTGDGHFAPIGGYHPERNMCLIFDTARFKYPPHWVSVKQLWDSLHYLDPTTNKPRGYSVLSRSNSAVSLMVFRVSPLFSSLIFTVDKDPPKSPVQTFVSGFELWLKTNHNLDSPNSDVAFIEAAKTVRALLKAQLSAGQEFVLTLQENYHQTAEAHKDFIVEIFEGLKQSKEFKQLQDVFADTPLNFKCCSSKESIARDPLLFVFMFILSWPMGANNGTWSQLLHASVDLITKEYPDSLRNEVTMLRKKFTSISCKSCIQ